MGPAKGKDFANAFGPFLVTADALDPKRDLSMTVRVNGEVWSQGAFGAQHWGFPLMVSHVSQGETVYPGDVFGSGTFHKGCGLDLDRWVRPGDVIELDVPAIGVLRNTFGTPAGQKELDYRKPEAAT
jgi:2-keto-4-pentenoate hydratase/2-oxohepta-3-ene-1,7-dioic acid hydratase in catechol pathway